MKPARLAILALCLGASALTLSACLIGTPNTRFYSYGGAEDYYGQTQPYQYGAYQYRDPYTSRRPYGYGGTQGPYRYSPQSRVFSPDRGVTCDRRKEVCYKWHDKSREWRPDRSDTKDTFGKKAARRLNQ